MNYELIDRGNKALSLLKAPYFDELIETMRLDIAQQMIRTNPADRDKREELYQVGYGLELFVKYLEKYEATGRFEADKGETNANGE